MMKLYGIDVSNNVNRVRYVANALGIEYVLEQVMPFSEKVQTPEYKQLHPASKVPVMVDDDGFVLYESNAIIRYLAQKYSSELYPKDLKKRAKVDQWMDFSVIHIGAAMGRVFWNMVAVRFLDLKQDAASLETGLKFLDKYLPIVDEQLSKSKFIAGEELSLADFSLLAALDPAEGSQVGLIKYAHLTRWRNNIKEKEFCQIDCSYGQALIAEKMASTK